MYASSDVFTTTELANVMSSFAQAIVDAGSLVFPWSMGAGTGPAGPGAARPKSGRAGAQERKNAGIPSMSLHPVLVHTDRNSMKRKCSSECIPVTEAGVDAILVMKAAFERPVEVVTYALAT